MDEWQHTPDPEFIERIKEIRAREELDRASEYEDPDEKNLAENLPEFSPTEEWFQLRDRKIEQLWSEGLLDTAIAERVGCSPKAVWRARKRMGLNTRYDWNAPRV